ncbi:MAG TPA: AraC family transcriptional regulator ligand-binding domain-containing protein [Sphingobium sp.]|uniref:AraC family transcriptional regulator ligand-binding domain-containing protein n=1 Tax=Sphingobium sp. TaxID=1912891 RepID=UPI002ED0CF51
MEQDVDVPDDAAFELVFAGTLIQFSELVRELGGEPLPLLHAARIEPAKVDHVMPQVSFRSMIDLLEGAAEALHCPDFGMRLAARQGGGQVFGAIGVVMRNSGKLGEALRYASEHIQAYSLAGGMPIEEEAETGRMIVGLDILLDGVPDRSQTVEQHLLLAHYNAMEITRGHARARQIRLRHQPLSSLRTYRAYFGCEVLFGQTADAIVFSHADMAVPVIDPDATQHERAADFIEMHFPPAPIPLHARVRGLVMKSLGVSDCGIDSIAGALCLHPRTLHRRLREERRSFEEVKDEVRRDLARYYIERSDLPFTQIAEKLGYSETSVLTRSCHRWFDASPRAVRRGGLVSTA